MTDENRHAVRTALNSLRTQVDRRTAGVDEPYMLFRLNVADYISLVALFFAWCATLLLLSGEPNWAIITMLGAFGFDKLDGFYAREFGEPTVLGRQIDAYIDVFTYLVPAAALYHFVLSPHVVVSAVVGFAVLMFGGLRLIRFTNEGLKDDDGTSYYRGITVVHVNLLVLANYFAFELLAPWNGWVAALTVVAAAPVMISDYRSYKTVERHSVVGVLGLVVVGLCFVLEYGL
ncbi:CDP-alcohol phosphatidyltransferase family protein [Halorientalis brevis]|uniref:CDP-alcohol phosphatidyltransferase family protein n=1 Tax=Halorientalis brevis TaxID=1126241 RepID=A0ABD6CAH1_9EURY|nr:CDP-alcohol phosphatidyltransferase family protein [Halorientalis brevis]